MSLQVIGPTLERISQCEAVLRSLPEWFGIEESLLMYAHDTARCPTFALTKAEELVAFISLRQHFAHAWEIQCVAVHAQHRTQGLGSRLLRHAEAWLGQQGATLLQVKTIAASFANSHYAETREFYRRRGFLPLEVFSELWPGYPCLQLIKALPQHILNQGD